MSETRALNAALSGPVFHGAATRSALHASERHVDRWAPEGPKAARSGGLRSLGFADRVAAPWMQAAMETRGARMMAQPMTDRTTPHVSWLFPRPWFQDELDWMASARVRSEQGPQFLTTRGTYESARSSSSDVAMPMVAPELVAPSMGSFGMPPGLFGSAGSSDGGSGYGQVHNSLRSYSPMVPFAAAAAAEVVAGTIGLAKQSGLASVAGAAERSPILGALAMVAPSAIAPSRSSLSTPIAPTASASSPPPTPTATQVMIDAARAAVNRVDDARHAPAPSSSAQSPAAESTAASSEPTASVSELAIADAASSSPQISRALRTVDLLLSASSSSPAPTQGEPARESSFAPSAGPRVAMPAGLGGLVNALDAQHTTTHPMARIGGMAAATPAPFAPALAASARALEMPLARAAMSRDVAAPTADGAAPARDVPGFSPVWAAPATALGAIAADRARGIDHVAWSDRWLARFVGASPVALASLDVAFDRSPASMRGPSMLGAPRTYDVASPEMSYLRPPMPAPALAAAIRASADVQPLDAAPAVAPRPVASPDRALRIDDNEAVSDDVFAAIAAATVARPPARPAEAARSGAAPGEAARVAPEPMTLTPADVVRAGSRPTIADLVSIAPPPAPGAGVSPGLASSPMAPAMAAMLPMPAAPVFDTRALFPESLGSAYLGGLLSRSASTIGVVSAAPTMSALVAAAGVAGAASSAAFTAPTGGFPGAVPSMTYVGLERFASGMGDARAWSTRDLAIAPSALRLSEAAPERVVLAMEQARRANGPTPFATGPLSAAEASMFEAPAALAARPTPSIAAPTAADAAPSVPPAETVPSEAAAESTATPAAPARSLDADLVGLRAALLAGGATSVPLAFAEFLPMLSAAMAAPFAATSPESFAASMMTSPIAGATAATVPSIGAAAAAADVSLPFVTSAAPSSREWSLAAPAGARGLALPAVGGITAGIGTTMPTPAASRFVAEALPSGEAGDVTGATPAGVLGARESLASWVALHAPAAATSTGRPGALAENMLSWSVAEERAVTDLSFDFVPPEMVLAAKVYGLSPGAAAHAARLAVAGPSAIASLATSIDLTFLRSFQQVHAQQQSGAAARAGGQPAAFGDVSSPSFAPDGTPIEQPIAGSAIAAPSIAASQAAAPYAAAASTQAEDAAAFGAPPMPSVAGSVLSSPRLPRGAFLWPEATVAALGLRAMSPEGIAGMPVVALELLAAAAVADLGTWVTAFPSADQATIANVIRGMGGTVPTTSTTPGPMTMLAAPFAARPGSTSAVSSSVPSSTAADVDAPPDAMTGFGDFGAAPRDIRARFEAIYVALAQTGDGQNLSPSARAARAMALLAREDGGTTSARERALTAWSMLPNVYQGGMDFVAPRDGAESPDAIAETRPGLASLAARAGDSLGSFVAPSAREVSSWHDDTSAPSLAARAEMPVYVNTAASSSQMPSAASAMSRPGRAFSQSGGGEPEIPAWFEAAARRMLDDRSPGQGMSLAELVLVTSAATPSKAIAAATRGTPAAGGSGAPIVSASAGGTAQKPDVEAIAQEVYQEVLRLIDIARERSGDPYQ